MAISNKTRFEIFKRDNFTCQYCGRKTPEVVLELDHIVPSNNSGSDDIQNLITACFECNRGKGKNELSKTLTRSDLKDDLYILAEQELQLKEYNAILRQKEKRINKDLQKIDKKFQEMWGEKYCLSVQGKRSMKYFLKFFTTDKIEEAIEVAGLRLSKKIRPLDHNLFPYTCGILHNWRREQKGA